MWLDINMQQGYTYIKVMNFKSYAIANYKILYAMTFTYIFKIIMKCTNNAVHTYQCIS